MRNILRAGAIFLLALVFCEGIGLDTLTVAQAQTKGRGALIANVRTEPATPRTGDKIRLLFDPSENVIRAEIKWTVNGDMVESFDYDATHTDIELNHPIKSGDVIVASITPYETGGIEGKKIDHQIVCASAPPVLNVVNQSLSGDGVYSAKIEAENPQGGPVTLKIERAPQGLTMDPEGNIQWKVGRGTSGKFSVKVVGEDASGQKSFLTYEIGIRWQK